MAETRVPLSWDGGRGLVDRAGGIEARGTAPGTYKNSGDLDVTSWELERLGTSLWQSQQRKDREGTVTAQQNTAEPEPAGAQRLLLSLEAAGGHEERVRWHRITLPGPQTQHLSEHDLGQDTQPAVLAGPHVRHGDAQCSLLWGRCDGTSGPAWDGTPPLRSARSARCRQAAFGEKRVCPGDRQGRKSF